jgi:hypothetical protein
MKALATWCIAHRRIVVVAWVVALIGANVIGGVVGSSYNSNFSGPKSAGSQRAIDLLAKDFPVRRGDSAAIVFESTAPFTSSAVRSEVDALTRMSLPSFPLTSRRTRSPRPATSPTPRFCSINAHSRCRRHRSTA